MEYTYEDYKEAKTVIEQYEQEIYENAKKVSENIRKDIIERTKDKYWTVDIEMNDDNVWYTVTNEHTYDEDYGGYYDKFIEIELAKKYNTTIHVVGIYSK